MSRPRLDMEARDRKHMIRFVIKILIALALLVAFIWVLSFRDIPKKIDYGVSFSKLHADELHLDWKETYDAILNDLGVTMLRLSAHWPMIEPQDGIFHFDEMDYQMSEAASHQASVILAVGRRLPGWPECHNPDWSKELSQPDRETKIVEYITAVVNRYKDSPALEYWQVENEAFLTKFAPEYCGGFNQEFLDKEIALVRKLDPGHKIVLTDSGEVGRWYRAWKRADVFASSMYLYVWYEPFGPVRYPIGPWFFRAKLNLMELLYGKKQAILSELGAEPWLAQPIIDASLAKQLDRMNIAKFDEVIKFARQSSFDSQYLWGAEWWYYMKEGGHPEFWEKAKALYTE